jgi:hypothetical protein
LAAEEHVTREEEGHTLTSYGDDTASNNITSEGEEANLGTSNRDAAYFSWKNLVREVNYRSSLFLMEGPKCCSVV